MKSRPSIARLREVLRYNAGRSAAGGYNDIQLGVDYSLHQKEDRPDSLRVDYFSGLRRIASEWVYLSHSGFARAKAELWWQKRAPRAPPPGSPAQAWEWLKTGYTLTRPAGIRINESGKYPEINGYTWETAT